MEYNSLLMIVLAFLLGFCFRKMMGRQFIEGYCSMTDEAKIHFKKHKLNIPQQERWCSDFDSSSYDCKYSGIIGPEAIKMCKWNEL